MAVADRVPPVGRPDVGAPGPRAGVAAGAVFDQAVAVVVFGEHLVGPLLDAGVVLRQPDVILAPIDVIPGGDQKRGIGVERRLGIVVIRREIVRVTGHAVGLAARENAIESQANQVERGEAPGQRRGVPGNVGILVIAQGAGVAGRVVGQGTQPGTELENVQPVAAKTVESPILRDSRRRRRYGDDVPTVLDAGPLPAGRRKNNPDEADNRAAGSLGIVPQRRFFLIGRGDSQRTLAGQMENRRQAHAAVPVESAQQRRAAELRIELDYDRLGRIRLRPARNQREAVRVEIDRPAGGRRSVEALPAILDAGGGVLADSRRRRGGSGGSLQFAVSEPATSQAIQ